MLTRQSILEGAVQRLAELSGDTGPWLSDTQRKIILRKLVRNLDITKGIWLFGYGSLMWNPAINFSEKKLGSLMGTIVVSACGQLSEEVRSIIQD